MKFPLALFLLCFWYYLYTVGIIDSHCCSYYKKIIVVYIIYCSILNTPPNQKITMNLLPPTHRISLCDCVRAKLSLSTFGIVGLLASAALLILISLTPYHNWGGDFASYIMQAQSILDGNMGEFLAKNAFTVKGFPELAPVAYPWGHPLLLIPALVFGGENTIFACKLVGLLFFLLSALVLYMQYKDTLPSFWVMSMVGLLVYNYVFIINVNTIFSDFSSMFFCMSALCLIVRAVANRNEVFAPRWDHALLGICIFAAYVNRATNLLLLPTLFATQVLVLFMQPALRRQPRVWIETALPYAAFFVCWLSWELTFPKGASYSLDLFSAVTLQNSLLNAEYYIGLLNFLFPFLGGPISLQVHLGDLVPFVTAPIANVLLGCALIFVVRGIWEHWRSQYPVLLFSAMLLGVYILFPGRQGLRYIFPILPFYLFFMIAGIYAMVRTASKKMQLCAQGAVLAFVLLVAGQSGYWAMQNYAEKGARPVQGVLGPYAVQSQELFRYIVQNTSPDSVITFFKPRVMRMLTGRNSRAQLDSTPLEGDYLCMYLWQDRAYYQPLIQSANTLLQQGRLQIVFKNDSFVLFKVL